jgi:hypothetical protein
MTFNGEVICFKDKLMYPPYRFGYSYSEYQRELEIRNSKREILEVFPYFLNPYAVGHMINHPEAGYQPNVCFLDIPVPFDFFPELLLRYFPYQLFAKQEGTTAAYKNCYHTVAIIALDTITDGTELLVNYGNDRFPPSYRPTWLVEPPDSEFALSYLTK